MNTDELIEIIQAGFITSVTYDYEDHFTKLTLCSKHCQYMIILRPHNNPLTFEVTRIKAPVVTDQAEEVIKIVVSPEECYKVGNRLCVASLKFAMLMENAALIEKVYYMTNCFLNRLKH